MLLGCSWSFLGSSWLPAPHPNCQDDPVGLPRYWMPISSQEVLLATPGCSGAAPGASWAAPGCPPPGGPAKVQDAQIQPGGSPGHSWVLLGCSWNFLGCSWLPVAMLARMPKSSQELFLATPGCGLLLEFSWASNALRPVRQHAAKLLPTCAELGHECNGGYGGKAQGFSKNPKP